MKKRLFLFLVFILCTNHCANVAPTSLDSLQKALPAVVAPPYECLEDKSCTFKARNLPALHKHLRTQHASVPSKCCKNCDSFFLFHSLHTKECSIFSRIPHGERKSATNIYYRAVVRTYLHEKANIPEYHEGEEFVKILQQTEVSVPPPKQERQY